MKNDSHISLIVPCYNEEANIQKGVLEKIGNFTKNGKQFVEVIIVDDGSTDSSKDIIEKKYLKEFPKFKLFHNNHQGKAFALISGIRNAKGDYVMFSDIDLATPIDEAEKFFPEIHKGYEIVIGSRTRNREGAPLSRKVLALGFIMIRNFLIGLHGIKDTQCGFKIFQRKAALDIIDHMRVIKTSHEIHGPSVSAAFDLEFLFLASKLGYKIKEVPVTWKHVETRNVNFLTDSFETLHDIFLIKYYDMAHKYSQQ